VEQTPASGRRHGRLRVAGRTARPPPAARRGGTPLRGASFADLPYPVDVVGGSATPPVSCWKDGREWRIGTDADVAWIQESTTPGMSIASAIPPVFAAYATIVVPDKDEGREEHTRLLLRLLSEQSGDQPWWLGYLETGADDVVFPDAPRVTLYADWPYVLVRAGPAEAARWRHDLWSWRTPGPDLVFPADRSWLLSWLWDDDWRCLGGPIALVERLLDQPKLQVRRVGPGEDATPPGHVAR
jgi:hypothetical protein